MLYLWWWGISDFCDFSSWWLMDFIIIFKIKSLLCFIVFINDTGFSSNFFYYFYIRLNFTLVFQGGKFCYWFLIFLFNVVFYVINFLKKLYGWWPTYFEDGLFYFYQFKLIVFCVFCHFLEYIKCLEMLCLLDHWMGLWKIGQVDLKGLLFDMYMLGIVVSSQKINSFIIMCFIRPTSLSWKVFLFRIFFFFCIKLTQLL